MEERLAMIVRDALDALFECLPSEIQQQAERQIHKP
jgi:hypothetical protein